MAFLCSLLLASPAARAWEGGTTHAGLAEQAAFSSDLHGALVKRFGVSLGLFGELTVPPDKARAFFARLLALLSPSQTYTPDARGKMTALGWLVAGSVLADTPRQNAANHFLNPRTGRGLSDKTLDERKRPLGDRVYASVVSESPPDGGLPATRWLRDKNNPGGLPAFRRHLELAATSAAPAKRDQQLALALYAAGDMLHVLADMGSPSHVRDDLGAHYDALGPDAFDVGSRVERIAALAYGRLGVPGPKQVERRETIDDYFVTKKQTGLADQTSTGFFSAYTLPRSFVVKDAGDATRELRRSLRLPDPGPTLDPRTAELTGSSGTCLANVTQSGDRYSFSMSDDCVLEQLGVILPRVAGFSAGFLDTLFGRALTVAGSEGGITVTGAQPGRLTLYWDDDHGTRARYDSRTVSADGSVTFPAPPTGARAVIAVNDGRELGLGRLAL